MLRLYMFMSHLYAASGLFKQHELMKSSSATELYIRQATPETYRQVLKEIRQKEIFKIIVDTNPHYINRFLRAVSELIKFLVIVGLVPSKKKTMQIEVIFENFFSMAMSKTLLLMCSASILILKTFWYH